MKKTIKKEVNRQLGKSVVRNPNPKKVDRSIPLYGGAGDTFDDTGGAVMIGVFFIVLMLLSSGL